jgi:hypothetical protein
MAETILIALSNPVSADSEDAFNEWYNKVHGKEVTGLAGIKNIKRYRAKTQLLPPGGEITYRYLALYDVDDANTALASLANASKTFNMSDTVDLEGANSIMFEQIIAIKE